MQNNGQIDNDKDVYVPLYRVDGDGKVTTTDTKQIQSATVRAMTMAMSRAGDILLLVIFEQ